MSLQISTIIATHDRPRFLLEALDSLAAQRLPPSEVIVVDDGSGPATRGALTRWQARPAAAAFALRYVRQRNRGPAAARNRGLRASRGAGIHFMDDDDLMAPAALQHLAQALAGAPGAAASMASHTLLHDGDAAVSGAAPAVAPQRGDVLAAMIAGQWFVPIHGYLFTRAACARMGRWDPRLSSQEDDEYLLRAALAEIDFIPAPQALVHYRQHGGLRRATPGKPGETVAEGLRKRLQDDLAIRERVFCELRARGRLEPQRAAFEAWHRRLQQRYGPLPEDIENAWAVLAWLGRGRRTARVAGAAAGAGRRGSALTLPP